MKTTAVVTPALDRNTTEWLIKRPPQLRKTRLALALTAALALPLTTHAAPGNLLGSEFRVNTFTANNQRAPRVASDAAGDFVMAWNSYTQDGSGYGVYAQRYNSAGAAQGPEFRVNTFTAGNQHLPSVAMDAAGDFVVAWQSDSQDGSGYGVYAQRYNSAGAVQGTEFRVNNTFTAGNQGSPSVAMDATGDFVVAWQSNLQDGSGYGVYAQRYNSAGAAQGAEFRTNTTTASDQYAPSVGMNAAGDFVVTWQSNLQDVKGSFGLGVYAQRYTRAGAAQGIEFQVNTFTASDQKAPSVAVDAAGDFMVAWQSRGQDSSGFGVYAQRYNSAGAVQGPEFRVNTFTAGDQDSPSVAVDAAGDFVVTWESLGGQDGSGYGVYAQRYSRTGAVQGIEFRVNTFTAGNQGSPSVAVDADGDFVVAWESLNQDGSGGGIYAQRFVGPENVDLSLALSASPNPVAPSGALSYHLMVSNTHPSIAPTGILAIDRAIGAATGVKLKDTLPTGTHFVSASGANWHCTPSGGTVYCAFGSVLAPGFLSTLTLNVTAPASVGSITDTASVTGNQADSTVANNSASQTTTVR